MFKNVSRHIFFFALASLMIFSVVGEAEACSCFSPSLQEAVENTPTIIVAKMQSVEKVKPGEKIIDDKGIKYSNFVVQKVYKGNLKEGQTMKFMQGQCCVCILAFSEESVGKEFLFFLDRKPGKDGLWAGFVCSRSNAVDWASADLTYLNRLPEVKGNSRLFGTINQEIASPIEEIPGVDKHLENHSVRITGNAREIELKTDKNGVYEVYDLPVGKYKVIPAKVSGFKFSNNEFEEVEIKAGQLEELNFSFEIDNSISGKFFDAGGKPLPNVSLDLIPVSGKKDKYFYKSASTDETGSFKFEEIPSGTYLIIVNEENVVTAKEPFGAFYYPGTIKKESAKEIKIDAGVRLKDININAPTTAETVMVNGILKFEDGTPVADEYVEFFNDVDNVNKIEKYKSADSNAKTDQNGRFSIKILKGRTGILFGEFSVYKGKYKNCPKLDALLSKSKDRFIDIRTSPKLTNASADISGVELSFPIPKCEKGN